MMDLILVVAKKGCTCPRRSAFEENITDSKPVEVPATAYYLRLIDDGSLVRVAAQKTEPESSKKSGGRK
jgi:hypothetical protein